MLLKRTENQDTVQCLFESTNILACDYNKETKELLVTFNRGAQYKYSNVPLSDYTRFELADSQGQILNSHIKKYTFTRMPDADANALVNEITKCQNEYLVSLKEELIQLFKGIVIKVSQDENTLEWNDLAEVETLITKLKHVKNGIVIK